MNISNWLQLGQIVVILGVGICEVILIHELRETRKFLQRINDNVLGAVGANMALNTAIAAAAAFLQTRGRDAVQHQTVE